MEVALAAAPARAADFVELTKPRITFLVLVTTAVGYALGVGSAFHPGVFLSLLVGTALVSSGASTLNQWAERDADARMVRTATRPLPSGRLAPADALAFGRVVPPIDSFPVAIAFAHRAWALVVAGLVFWAAAAAHRSGLRRSALFLAALVPTQVALGALTVLSRKGVAITTAHVATGALLLATSLALSLGARSRVRRPEPAGMFVETRALAWK